MILGAGGVVPSIICALQRMNASKIVLSNRTKKKADHLKELFKEIEIVEWGSLPEFDMIINATTLGLKKNDTVLVHSNISDIGFTDIDLKTSINILHKSLCTVIGDNGTICVPSFYWEFNKKKVFELNKKSSLNLNIGIYSYYSRYIFC